CVTPLVTTSFKHISTIFLFHVRFKADKTSFTCLHARQVVMNVAAAVGEQACLNCLLIQTKEVLQVTWQKILPDGERTVATDNLHFGQRVDPYFSGKVEFRDAGLQNTSILIRNLTEQDEGYYRCMFNTYPDGAFIATTCLKLYGQYLL
uniref:Ig-like domain-containing protein n=1 Tax=Labrus bergylta TaxID=56723 RepID=A0A3Q3ESW7_9LABR